MKSGGSENDSFYRLVCGDKCGTLRLKSVNKCMLYTLPMVIPLEIYSNFYISTPKIRKNHSKWLLLPFENRTKIQEKSALFGLRQIVSHRQFFFSPMGEKKN